MTEIINTAFYKTKNSSPGVLNTSMTLKERMESLKKDLAEKVTSAKTKEARHEALKNAFNKHAEYLKPASSRVNYLRKFFEEKIINIDDPEQREKEKKEAFTGDDIFVKFNKSFFTAITNKQNIPIKTPSLKVTTGAFLMMKNGGKTDHKRITGQILVTCLGCSEQDLSGEKHLINDLYADSLALIDMVIMISEQLKIDMDEKDIINIDTVNDLYCWVENKILAVSSDFA